MILNSLRKSFSGARNARDAPSRPGAWGKCFKALKWAPCADSAQTSAEVWVGQGSPENLLGPNLGPLPCAAGVSMRRHLTLMSRPDQELFR